MNQGGVWQVVYTADVAGPVPELKQCGPDCPVRVGGRQAEFVEVGVESVKSDVLEVFSDVWPVLKDDLKLPAATRIRWFAPAAYGTKAIGSTRFKARDDLSGFAEADVWVRVGPSLRASVSVLAHEARHRAGGGEREAEQYAELVAGELFRRDG